LTDADRFSMIEIAQRRCAPRAASITQQNMDWVKGMGEDLSLIGRSGYIADDFEDRYLPK
jgi:hypothetical protein